MRYPMPALAAGLLFLVTPALSAPKAASKTTPNTAARTAVPDPVDTIVRDEVQKRHVPGAAVAVTRNGKVVFSRAYGYADLELKVPARPDTLFEIGSVTKQFTAALVMMQVEEGRIRLDALASDYLADWPAAWSGVTVRHLLTHTSGIPNYTAQPDFSWVKDYGPGEIVGLVREKPLEFAPGERMSYSNTGYYLLGEILEKVSGKSYGDLLRERILAPIGMSHTRLSSMDVIPNRAHGYSPNGTGFVNAPTVRPAAAGAAGAILSSVEDMVKWDAALSSNRLLKAASREAMWAPTKLTGGGTSDYAFGWVVTTEEGRRVMEHGGGTAGFASYITRAAPENVTVVVLTNEGGGPAESIAHAVLGHYIPALKPAPPAKAPAKDPDPARTARVKGILLNLLSEKPDLSPFTDEMKAQLKPELLEGARRQIGALGPLKSLVYLSDTDTPQGHVYQYRATFGAISLAVLATFTKEEQVAGFFLKPE